MRRHSMRQDIFNCIKDNDINRFYRFCVEYRGRGNINDIKFLKGRNILHVAAFFNRIEIIRLFINFSGYNIGDLVDFDLKTPLLVAASKGHFNAVRELLVYNPGVIDIPDNKGMTPLMYSCKSSRIGMSNISKFLLNKGANYTRTANDGYKIPIRYINYLIPNFVPIYRPIHRPNRRPIRRTPIQTNSRLIILTPPSTISSESVDVNVDNSIHNTLDDIDIPNHFKNQFIDMAIELDKSCSICLEKFEIGKTVFTKCSHLLCSNCFNDERLNKCPLCRVDIK